RIRPGHALIAPGNLHLRVRRDGKGYRVALENDPPVNGHRPSIDVLFASAAAAAGSNAVGVILTGMGADGAQGLWAMKRAGARTPVAWEVLEDLVHLLRFFALAALGRVLLAHVAPLDSIQ